MDPATMMALAQGGIGLIQTVAGEIGSVKTNSQLKTNSALRPDYHIAKPILDNQAIAESRASHGLNDRTLNNYNEFTQRNLTGSLDTLLKGGSSMNNIGDLFSSADEGERKLAILDDEMNAKNTQILMDQNREMGGELDKEWEMNKWAPWADRQQELTQKLQRQQGMLSQGVNTAVSAGANYFTGKMYQKQIDGVFGPKTAAAPAGVSDVSFNRIQEANHALANLDHVLGPPELAYGTPPPQQPRRSTQDISTGIRFRYPGLMGGRTGKQLEYQPSID